MSPDARDVVLRATDVPVGYRLLTDHVRSLDEIAVSSANEVAARQRQFVDGYARGFQHTNAATITSKVAIYRRPEDAQAELDDVRFFALQPRDPSTRRTLIMAATVGDDSIVSLIRTDFGGVPISIFTVDFRAGSVGNSVVLAGRPQDVSVNAVVDMARLQLARALRTKPGQPYALAAPTATPQQQATSPQATRSPAPTSPRVVPTASPAPTVAVPVPARIFVRGSGGSASTILYTGQLRAFEAEVLDQFNRPMSGTPVVWSVTPPSLGTITGSGLFTAGSPGVGYISARANAVTSSYPDTSGRCTYCASVEVLSLAPTRIDVTPHSAAIKINQTIQLTAIVREPVERPAPTTVVWTISTRASCVGATITQSGLFRAGATRGACYVVATAGPVSDSEVLIIIE